MIISRIPVCYINYHGVSNFHYKKLLMLTNSIILTISGRDTLRPSL